MGATEEPWEPQDNMKKQKFSDLWIRALEPKDKPYRIREDKGFTIRVLPSGVKRWEYIYDSPITGKRRFMGLGNFPDVKLKEAHKAHNDAHGLYLKGIDPQEPITAPEPAPAAEKTIKDLYEAYIQDCRDIQLNPRSVKHKEQRLSAHIVERWGNRLVTSVKKDEAVALIRELAKDKPGTARNVMLAARAMFNWAAEEGWTEERNPFSNVLKRVPQAAANEKDRWLNASEIQHVLPLLKASKEKKNKKKAGENGPSIIRRVIIITLYTGQRPGEVCGLKWSDLEDNGRYWFISPEVAKNDIGSLLYLSAPVRRLIEPLRGLDPEYVFPASRGAEGATLVTSLDAHVERYLGGKYAGLPRWTPHDLRRTCSTHLQRLKCPGMVIDSIQNHKQPGVQRIYNRYEYIDEKREWLIRWAWEIRRLLRGK